MITKNQQEIIDLITKEFISINNKIDNSKFNFFDVSSINRDNETAREQITEAHIRNCAVANSLILRVKEDIDRLRQDFKETSILVRGGRDLIPIENPSITKTCGSRWWVDTIIIHTDDISIEELIFDYYLEAVHKTAANGQIYYELTGNRDVTYGRNSGNVINLKNGTLADLFKDERVTNEVTNLYKKVTRV